MALGGFAFSVWPEMPGRGDGAPVAMIGFHFFPLSLAEVPRLSNCLTGKCLESALHLVKLSLGSRFWRSRPQLTHAGFYSQLLQEHLDASSSLSWQFSSRFALILEVPSSIYIYVRTAINCRSVLTWIHHQYLGG